MNPSDEWTQYGLPAIDLAREVVDSQEKIDPGRIIMAKKRFSVEDADAGQVAEQIGTLRATLAALEKKPMSAAAAAPEAVRNLLEIIENINLRLADLEAEA